MSGRWVGNVSAVRHRCVQPEWHAGLKVGEAWLCDCGVLWVIADSQWRRASPWESWRLLRRERRECGRRGSWRGWVRRNWVNALASGFGLAVGSFLVLALFAGGR